MKRKYIIRGGIVLLLLSGLIADDYYINNNHKFTTGNGTSTQSSGANKTQDGTLVDNSTTVDINNADEPIAPSTLPIAFATKKNNTHASKTSMRADQTPLIQSSGLNEVSAGVESADQLVASNYPEKEIVVEKRKTYFGNVPVTETKKQHKGISLPANLLGVEVGYSQGALTNNHTQSMQVGNIMAGLLVNVSIGNHFAIQPGIRYITGGNRLLTMNNANDEKLKLHYLQMPANLVWKFGRPGTTRFMIGATPYVSYLINAKDKLNTNAQEGNDFTPSPQYNTGAINKLDYGVGGFVGIQSPEGIFAKVGTQYGMTDILKNADGSSNRNTTFFASFGYILGGR
jgi:hypothetical protein